MMAQNAAWSRPLGRVADLLFPPLCLVCGGAAPSVHQLCPTCADALPPAPDNLCLRCGHPLPRPLESCGACLGHPLLMDATYCAFPYQGVAGDLVRACKFRDRGHWAELMAALCWERLGSSLRWEAPDMVIPIPLHPLRLIARRYNQSALLAGALARFLQRPLVTNALKRIKMSPPQTSLRQRERLLNARGAFAAQTEGVANRAILLVDDVMTTGATLNAASEVLKRAGAKRVAAVCFARTLDPRQGADNGGVPARRPVEDVTKQ